MVTALTTSANVKTILGIASGDTSQDALVALYLSEASTLITEYCGYQDFGLQAMTEIQSGNNEAAIALRQLPVQGITLSGTTTANSTSVTGLPTSGSAAPNAANLFVNQSVFGPGIQQGTILTAVNASAGTGTLSLPATASGTVSLAFGVAVWLDDNAFGRSAYGSFAASTLLTEGVDYYVSYDAGPGSQCSDGLIFRIGYYWFSPYVWVQGLVSPQKGPPTGNIQVQYVAGYATIPASLQAACELLITNMKQSRVFGRQVQSMSRDGLSVSLAADDKMGLLSPPIRAALARFKKINIG